MVYYASLFFFSGGNPDRFWYYRLHKKNWKHYKLSCADTLLVMIGIVETLTVVALSLLEVLALTSVSYMYHKSTMGLVPFLPSLEFLCNSIWTVFWRARSAKLRLRYGIRSLIVFFLCTTLIFNHCNILVIKVTKWSVSKLLTSSLLAVALSRGYTSASVSYCSQILPGILGV